MADGEKVYLVQHTNILAELDWHPFASSAIVKLG